MKEFVLGIFIGSTVLVGLNIISGNFSFSSLLPFISFASGAVVSYFMGENTKKSIFSGTAAALLGLFVLVLLMQMNFFQVNESNKILFIVFSAVFMVFGFGFGSIINIRIKVRKMLKEVIKK